MTELQKISRRIINESQGITDLSLLNWSMNQLFRAARTMQLLNGADEHVMGCDTVAIIILEKLIKTPEGYKMVRDTNTKLLRGYSAPKEIVTDYEI